MRKTFALAFTLALATPAMAQSPPTLSLTIMSIKVTNVTGKASDWIALYPHGAPDNSRYIDWLYVACGAKTCPQARVVAGSTTTVQFNVSKLGLTDIRYMSVGADHLYHSIAQIDPDFTPH